MANQSSSESTDVLRIPVAQLPTGSYAVLPETVLHFAPAQVTQATNIATTTATPNMGDRDAVCMRWGINNTHPTEVRKLVNKVPMAGQAIERRVKMLYGSGLFYYLESDVVDGDTKLKRHYSREIEDFIRVNRIRTHWYPNQCMDYITYANCFSEIILSRDRTRITNIYHKSAEHCRLNAQNRFGRSEYLLYSPYWEFGQAGVENRVPIRLYQWDDADNFFETLRSTKYAWHTQAPGLATIAYATAPHVGLFREKGWISVSANVPEIVSTMQTNQVSIKYMIIFSEGYFKARHPEWGGYDAKKRQQVFDDKVGEINRALTGTENVLKTLATMSVDDAYNPGKNDPGLRIEAIDDKAKRDVWVPDSEKADQQIVLGFGNDPSLVGLETASNSMGAGSGSDKRVGFDIGTTMNSLDQEVLIELLNHVAHYNRWGVRWGIAHSSPTTLNENKSGVQHDPATLITT